ncbi:D-alanyl-D-alanine carboxypeptidase [Streptomyces sp. NPDC005303]|uniref:D-alanyl-D-alanine carboxypeptidase n=1 Tax=Streptomyces sp. NPDC005303 TaxID=3155713 RepID=UPI00339DC378
MEEASVAGESPDRSKQRESSVEPTSGSASPVPEARSSARDPRLAVARESISPGGVDTATRVFSVRDLPKPPEDTDKSPTEPDTDGSGPAEPADTPPAAQTAPEAPGEAGPADTTPDDAGTAKAPGDSETAEGPQDSDTAEAGDASGTTGDPDDAGTAKVPDDSETGDGPEDSGTAKGSGGSDSRSDDPGTAAGPDGSGATEGPSDSETAEGPDDADTAKVPDDSETADGPEDSGTAEGSGGSDSGTDDSGTAEVAGGSDEPATARDARLRDAVAAWVATGDGSGKAEAAAKPEGDGAEPADAIPEDESAPDPEAKADSVPATVPEGAVAEEAPAEDEGEAPETGDPNPPEARGTARPAPTDPKTDDDPTEDAEPEDAKPEDDAPPEDAKPDDAGAADERPVDQPTAVFKAPRPPVDQPTTMLKLGKAAAPEEKPRPEPEAAAERTSKFVALKALDEPREARPKPDVTAAVPQVGPERTTQQPLPPKPPLDLLAELTNTPPPPPSPLRTLGRRVKIWTPILILLVVVFAIAQSLRPLPAPTLSLTAEDSYTFDGSKVTLPWPTQGQGWMDVNGVGTMDDFGKQTPVAIGSVAKAMTAYIVLKDHPLKSGEEGPKITVDALAEKEGGYNKQGESTLDTVKKGDALTQRQAIAAIMIPSANNIARLLARWDAGSEAAFIKKMNDTAQELGMKNTKYTDASGLKETTVSSAEDQVKLGNELVKIPALMEITSMGQWVDPSGQKWYNYNYLVPYTGIGIKTGTTSAAGGNLLFASRKEVGGETVTVVGAILGQHKAPIIKTVNDVSKVALLAAEDALKSAKILKKGDVVGYVDDGLGGHTPVVLTKDVTAVGWAGFKVKLSFAADDVPHTAKAGTKVGSLTVGDGEGGAVKVPVTLQKDLTEPGFTDKLTRVG